MPIDTSGETSERQAFSPVGSNAAEYLEWGPAESPVVVRMHLDAVDGIARDVIEGVNTSPRRDVEVGGLLLGRVTGSDQQVVWIERYQRISCDHSFGPHFILDAAGASALEQAATGIFATREMAVVGLYRSHTRPGLQLEESDYDLIRRYFSDPSDLVLLVKAVQDDILVAEFYRFDLAGGAQPVGERFAFCGNAVTPDTQLVTPDTERTVAEAGAGLNHMAERLASKEPEPARSAGDKPFGDRPRRLVPDFVPSPVEPAPSVFGLSDPDRPEPWPPRDETESRSGSGGLKKWLPLLAALLLVGGIAWFVLRPGQKGATPSTPAQTTESVRPLGLYVDPLGQTWRVLWNPNATALHDARNVVLFVREGDDQKLIEPSPRDLAAGSYEYRPTGADVTFRLEVTDKTGKVSAESFRLVKSSPVDAAAHVPLPAAGAPKPTPEIASPPSPAAPPDAPASARNVQPKPIYRAPPVVAAGIRPRINGTIPIDVKVRIDNRGRVVSATTVTKLQDGMQKYLATRALQAARQWKFQPARENGKAVAGSQTIHFVFTK